jgi:hypothetical protein
MHPTTLPWYRSQVIVAAIISVITKLLVGFGIIDDIAPAVIEEMASTIVLITGGLADLWVVRARITQKAAPSITVTKQ